MNVVDDDRQGDLEHEESDAPESSGPKTPLRKDGRVFTGPRYDDAEGPSDNDRRNGTGRRESLEQNVRVRFRPLAYYSQQVTELGHSRFLEIYNHPVLLYSESPAWLEGVRIQFKTIVIDPGTDQLLSPPVEAESRLPEVRVVEILKCVGSASKDMICVGRTTNNDIVFANSTISKFHAYFLKAADGHSYGLVDADSTNGTKVNNRRLIPHQNHPLVGLDRIEFGNAITALYLTPGGFYKFLQEKEGGSLRPGQR